MIYIKLGRKLAAIFINNAEESFYDLFIDVSSFVLFQKRSLGVFEVINRHIKHS